jgi:hypothetical protein
MVFYSAHSVPDFVLIEISLDPQRTYELSRVQAEGVAPGVNSDASLLRKRRDVLERRPKY